MKVIKLIMVMLLAVPACTHQIPPQRMADMPGDTEVPPKKKPERQSQQMRVNENHVILAAIAAGLITWWYVSSQGDKQRRGNCGDCYGDGIIHRGDPLTVRIRFSRAYLCPVCNGDGRL